MGKHNHFPTPDTKFSVDVPVICVVFLNFLSCVVGGCYFMSDDMFSLTLQFSLTSFCFKKRNIEFRENLVSMFRTVIISLHQKAGGDEKCWMKFYRTKRLRLYCTPGKHGLYGSYVCQIKTKRTRGSGG